MDKIGQYEIYDVYNFITVVPWYKTKLFYISCIIFFVLIIVNLLFFFLKNKKNDSPEVEAIKNLKKLREKLKNINNSYDQFYLQLTNIFKKYIYKKFGINVISATDFETINIISSSELKNYFSANLLPIFQKVHLIKFYKTEINKEQILNDLDSVEKFILLTSDINKKR
ncbi:hypothetical protein M1446_03020 [Candidatus Dependentiae bacterium]|nr:hypothetical protein [Candidatus Dependentiae bacterium]